MEIERGGGMKRVLILIVALSFMLSINRVEAKTFKDVPNGSPYRDAVHYLSEEGIINGYPDGSFQPNRKVTRGEATVIVSNFIKKNKLPTLILKPEALYLKDVGVTTWYYEGAIHLYAAEIMNGYLDQSFQLNRHIQRDQLAKIVANAIQLPEVEVDRFYEDTYLNSWNYPFIQSMTYHQIIPKEPNGKFRTTALSTRGELAIWLYNAHQLVKKEGYTSQLKGKVQWHHPNIEMHKKAVEQKKLTEKWKSAQYVGPAYLEEPILKQPFKRGTLRTAYQQDALRTVYYVRNIAGLYQKLSLDFSFNEQAQWGANILAMNNTGLSHQPKQPIGLGGREYSLGYSGTSTGNIAYGFTELSDSVIKGYMMDSDNVNRQVVGHRRWLLCPCLQKIGVGQADSIARPYRTYSVIKVMGTEPQTNQNAQYPSTITWPSMQAFPKELFYPMNSQEALPWSVSLSPQYYKLPKKESVQVRLTRMRDKKVFSFSNQQADGYFTVDTQLYGEGGAAIIFQPNVKSFYPLVKDEIFKVQITGLQQRSGSPTEIQYYTVIH